MKSARILSDDFNRVIEATRNFVGVETVLNKSKSFIKLEFSAANNKMTAIAVDGFRMSVESCVISDCEKNFEAYIRPAVKLKRGRFAVIELDEDSKEVNIRCDGFHFGYEQPEKSDFDWVKALPSTPVQYRIGFNGNYLLQALQAAKVSCGGNFRKPVVLEFRSPNEPMLIRTNNGEDIKLVMPIRLQEQKEGSNG